MLNKELTAKPQTIGNFLASKRTQIESVLPKHMSVNRVLRIAMTSIEQNTKLKECTPDSLFGAIIQCCILGMEPGSTLSMVYLIPYEISKNVGSQKLPKWEKIKVCQFILGYRGMIELARRAGTVISAHVVYENDVFSYQYGLHQDVKHIPATFKRGQLTAAYCIATLPNGMKQFEVMNKEEIYAIRARSKAFINAKDKTETIWVKDEAEMWRKTVVRRMFKYLPHSIEIMDAITLDDAAESGQQHNEDIIDGELYESINNIEIGTLNKAQKEKNLENVFSQAPEKTEEEKINAQNVAKDSFGEDDFHLQEGIK